MGVVLTCARRQWRRSRSRFCARSRPRAGGRRGGRAVETIAGCAAPMSRRSSTPTWRAACPISSPYVPAGPGRGGHRGRAAPAAGAAPAGYGLADALTAVHAAGVVHEDLKPSNVMLSDELPVVIDVGIAQGPDATRLTRPDFMGTPAYLAPEVIEGSESERPTSSLGSTVAFAAPAAAVRVGSYEAVFYKIVNGQADLIGVPSPCCRWWWRPCGTGTPSPGGATQRPAARGPDVLAQSAVLSGDAAAGPFNRGAGEPALTWHRPGTGWRRAWLSPAGDAFRACRRGAGPGPPWARWRGAGPAIRAGSPRERRGAAGPWAQIAGTNPLWSAAVGRGLRRMLPPVRIAGALRAAPASRGPRAAGPARREKPSHRAPPTAKKARGLRRWWRQRVVGCGDQRDPPVVGAWGCWRDRRAARRDLAQQRRCTASVRGQAGDQVWGAMFPWYCAVASPACCSRRSRLAAGVVVGGWR
jgi:hypothetical protein